MAGRARGRRGRASRARPRPRVEGEREHAFFCLHGDLVACLHGLAGPARDVLVLEAGGRLHERRIARGKIAAGGRRRSLLCHRVKDGVSSARLGRGDARRDESGGGGGGPEHRAPPKRANVQRVNGRQEREERDGSGVHLRNSSFVAISDICLFSIFAFTRAYCMHTVRPHMHPARSFGVRRQGGAPRRYPELPGGQRRARGRERARKGEGGGSFHGAHSPGPWGGPEYGPQAWRFRRWGWVGQGRALGRGCSTAGTGVRGAG